MSSFGFVPRSLSKRKGVHAPPRQQPVINPTNGSHEDNVAGPSTLKEEPDKSKFTTDDITSLVRLCLSRYSCWFSSELSQVIRKSGEGYVPIQYLLDHVSPLCELENKPSELEIVQGLRSVEHEDCEFEVRMIIREPTRNEWLRPSSSNSRDDIGTFEIRRKDHAEVVSWLDGGGDSQQQRVDKRYWDLRTVYIEHIPTMYRTKHAIAQYIYQLLTNSRSWKHKKISKNEYPIQAVTFPAHHLSSHNADENPHGQRRAWYKGFAFVILDSPSLSESLCKDYPWNRDAKPSMRSKRVRDAEALTLAVKFGTRVLSKAMWEEFKNEYLEYQKKIVLLNSGTEPVELSSSIPEGLDKDKSSVAVPAPAPVQRHHEGNKLGSGPSSISHPSKEFVPPATKSYPENCLVFIKNTHPETNKTTLRQLFSSVLSSPSALDYVDFTKGVDSCHLRLTNASEAKRLVSYFSAGGKPHQAQLGALDNESGIPTGDRPAIIVELVQGKREELYWEKVPQKSREKALITARGQTALSQDGDEVGESRSGDRRKRRKR